MVAVCPDGCETEVCVNTRRPENVRVAVPVLLAGLPRAIVVVVVDDSVSGGITDTSSTTSPREAFRVTEITVKR